MRSAKGLRTVLGVLGCAGAVLVALTGCTPTGPKVGAPDPGLRGAWVLQSGQDGYGAMELLGQDISLTVSSGSVATGRASCSDYTATILGSERSLWVKTSTPQSFSCTSAEQSVLQLEYLTDLARVQRSSITGSGLELSGPGVDLKYASAHPLQINRLADTPWQLSYVGTITLHGPVRFTPETGGFILFESQVVFTGATKCLSFTGKYQQVADTLVADHVNAVQTPGCDRTQDKAASDLMRVLDGGFSFSFSEKSLVLTSSRSGLILDLTQGGTK